MDKRVFIIHGWEGNPQANWFPWLKGELESQGFSVAVPALPDSARPVMEKWVPYLAQTVDELRQEDYFVGHSLGCITILRYLESLKEVQTAGGVVLVGGSGQDLNYPDYKGELSSFFAKPLDWERIKVAGRKFISLHSGNDPWVSLANSELFREKLGAEAMVIPGMGHFKAEDGCTELPIALESVLKIAR